MKIKDKVKLYDAMDKWLDGVSESGHEKLVYRDLLDDMLRAAELVYDACMKGQTFAEREQG